MSVCEKCGKALTCDEVSLYLRIVNRNAKNFKCLHCLADYFGCKDEVLQQKITYFKKMGCALFVCE